MCYLSLDRLCQQNWGLDLVELQRNVDETEWLMKWIRDSKGLIASGDEDAKAMYSKQFKKMEMSGFPDLTDDEINGISESILKKMVLPKKLLLMHRSGGIGGGTAKAEVMTKLKVLELTLKCCSGV